VFECCVPLSVVDCLIVTDVLVSLSVHVSESLCARARLRASGGTMPELTSGMYECLNSWTVGPECLHGAGQC
jgi:hypothetical protein